MMRTNTISSPNDPSCTNPPVDTVQCLKWSPGPNNFLCATSWNGSSSIWEINSSGQNVAKAQNVCLESVLSVSWKTDSSSVFLGSCDNQVRIWDLHSNEARQIGAHDGPVSEVLWCEQINHVISGSWDSSVSFWDGRSQSPSANAKLANRVLGMALKYPVLVAILSDKKYAVWDLRRLGQGNYMPEVMIDATAKYSLRCVDLYSDGTGFGVGLVEGRCFLKKINPSTFKVDADISYKCHRDITTQTAYSVNAINFHPTLNNIIATGGSDASILFYDKNLKSSVKSLTGLGGPVTAMDFNSDGSILAYATGYDWALGSEFTTSNLPKICYRPCLDDIKPRLGYK